MSRDTQTVLAVTGSALFLWLAFRADVSHLLPAPTFAGRLMQIAPALAAFVAGIGCLLWMAVLIRQPQPRKSKQSAATGVPEAATQRWTTAKIFLAGGYYLSALFLIGERFARFLWPLHSRRISAIAGAAGLVLLIADAAFRWGKKKQANQNETASSGVKEEGWFANDFLRGLFFLVVYLGVIFVSIAMVRHYRPAHANAILGIIVLGMMVGFAFLRENSRRSVSGLHRGSYRPRQLGIAGDAPKNKQLWLTVYGAGIAGLMFLPLPTQWKTGIFFGQIPLVIGYLLVVSRLKMQIYRLGHDGQTDRALAQDGRWRWMPGYGMPLEGPILFNAGRYREAQEAIWPTAFDAEGKPRLGSSEIYTYALALNNDSRFAEAQSLLEASIPVAAKPDGFRVALATNLLEQGKDPERARALLEEAMATPALQSTGYGRQADEAKRAARYAWALASCGRKQEAAVQMQAALERGAGLKNSDLAGIHYFAGEAWRAAGETANARTAFQESLRLMPDGVAAISSKKGLARLAAG